MKLVTWDAIAPIMTSLLCDFRADSRLGPSQWEMSLQSNTVSHWLGANLESALLSCQTIWTKVFDLEIQSTLPVNTLRLRQNGCHFQRHFTEWKVWISLKMSLKFAPRVRIDNIPAFVQMVAWHRPGHKSLSEPIIMVSLLTHIWVTRL